MKALWKQEAGEATIEFVGMLALLVLPLIYTIVALAQIQSYTYATNQINHAIAQLAAQGGQRSLINQQIEFAKQDYHLGTDLQVELECGACLAGETATVKVTTHPALPGTAAWPALAKTLVVPVESSSTIVLSRDLKP
ncbi:hypothetical protein BSR28_00175 [Boudabousia liubingyangii]|uniref:hypothetical protein n=1 Tax=Boudabousia liubingyangii TaxID=1921764 RepID=UPI00093AA085|nr:hypothetical protein [Boudabousia liubingyangii]OKL48169.1 hypothetical protein BSR28_00175 [Boudabousia liubingyangii]